VSYSMEITDIDPLEYGLLFERFLNPERISMPDIDIDFHTRRRGEVIQYVTEKYGREQVAQIITFGTLGARTAIKDVGRVLDIGFADVDRITKLIPTTLNIKLKDAMQQEPAIEEAALKDPRLKEVLEVASKIEGMARNAGMHAAGVVISPVPLRELVPLCKTSKDEIVTQYDMVGLEKLALLKMDFLGLTTLDIIQEAVALIEQYRGVKLDTEKLPLDDAKTYQAVFAKGLTSGIFQFESSGMRDILRRYQPDRLDDLIALNALYRPGPMDMIDDFIDRKHGRKEVAYDIAETKDILEESFGVIVYQEQVMQLSSRLAGYSLGEADILRRAMGKKKQEEMDKQRERFVSGAKAKGFPQKKVEKVFDQMAKFAGYGFNKSHSAAYAYLAYVVAYLKTHYPVEFMSALLTSEMGSTDKVVKYINECREMGIPVLPPDVNSSGRDFSPDGQGIRMGLCAIRNVGGAAADSIIEARESGGPFESLYDLCERVDLTSVNRRILENFIKSGALASLGGNRAQLTAVIENAMESGQRAWKDRESGQAGLFGAVADEPAHVEHPLPALPEWTVQQKLAGEKEVLGIFVTGHPLDEFSGKVAQLSTHDTETLEGLERGTEVAVCGILTGIQRKRNREGKLWAAMRVEDRKGGVEAMAFSTQYDRLLSNLVEDQAVLVRGLVLPEENGPPKLSVQDIVPLAVARVNLPTLISIRVPVGVNGTSGNQTGDKAAALNQLFARKQGATDVRLRLEKPRDFSVILDVTPKVCPDKEFWAEVERICGPESWEILAN
jgi:DNA polymerase-3 subunit alpha